MLDDRKRVPARFYATPQGREPVREWLEGLEVGARRRIGFDLKQLEYGWSVGMPLVDRSGAGSGSCAAACRTAASSG